MRYCTSPNSAATAYTASTTRQILVENLMNPYYTKTRRSRGLAIRASDAHTAIGGLELVETARVKLLEIDVDNAERLRVTPAAAREVGNVDRRAAVADGPLREFVDRRPAREVIDVLIERQAVLQAVRPAESR